MTKINVPYVVPKKGAYKPPSYPHLAPFFNMMLIYGVKGSGKTLTMANVIKLQFPYNSRIFYFSPTAKNDNNIKQVLGKTRWKQIEFIEDFNKHTLSQVLQLIESEIDEWRQEYKLTKKLERYVKKYGEKHVRHYIIWLYENNKIPDLDREFYLKTSQIMSKRPVYSIILDDTLGNPLLTARNDNILTNFCIKHRHYFTNVYLLLQYWKGINKTIRSNISEMILFLTYDKDILEDLYSEMGLLFKNKEEFMDVMSLLHKNRHNFIYIDKANHDIRLNFDTPL